VWHVKWLNIAVENVKLPIDHNTRKSVEDELLNYTMNNCSNNHRQMMIVYVSYECLRWNQGLDISHVVEKLFAVDVHMLLCMTTKATKLTTKSVPFAERQSLILKRKQ